MAKDPTPTSPSDSPLYPAGRAFLIAFRRDAEVEQGEFAGRVEHVSSGRAASFASLDVLVEFMRRVSGQEPTRRDG